MSETFVVKLHCLFVSQLQFVFKIFIGEVAGIKLYKCILFYLDSKSFEDSVVICWCALMYWKTMICRIFLFYKYDLKNSISIKFSLIGCMNSSFFYIPSLVPVSFTYNSIFLVKVFDFRHKTIYLRLKVFQALHALFVYYLRAKL